MSTNYSNNVGGQAAADSVLSMQEDVKSLKSENERLKTLEANLFFYKAETERLKAENANLNANLFFYKELYEAPVSDDSSSDIESGEEESAEEDEEDERHRPTNSRTPNIGVSEYFIKVRTAARPSCRPSRIHFLNK